MTVTVANTLVIAFAVALVLTVIIFETVIYFKDKQIHENELWVESCQEASHDMMQSLAVELEKYEAKVKRYQDDIQQLQSIIREYERELESKETKTKKKGKGEK